MSGMIARKDICLYNSSEKNDLEIKISFITYLYDIIQITYKIFSRLKFIQIFRLFSLDGPPCIILLLLRKKVLK